MDFRFAHDFDIDPQGFWTLFFSEDFAEDMFKRTGMKNRKVLEYKDSGDRIVRTQRVEPDMPVPAWASAVVSSTAYTEYDVYDKAASKMDVRIEPGMMSNRFKMSGVFSVTPLGPGRCQRVFSGEVKVSVMLIGGKIEQYMIDEMRKGYDRAADVTREWITKKKQSA
jgi:hypothetical protein